MIDLHIIEKVGDIFYLTNAGGILSGDLPNCTIKCAKFKGESVINFIDR